MMILDVLFRVGPAYKLGGSDPAANCPDFLRLANALSALYPKESEEKKLLDAMLLAMPR